MNALCILFLLLILPNLRLNSKAATPDRRIFMWMTITCISTLVIDALGFVLEGAKFEGAGVLLFFVDTLYYLVSPICASLWLFYIDYKVFGDTDRFKTKYGFWYAAPYAINALLTIANIFTPVIFSIGEGNIYIRESLLPILVALQYICLAYSYVFLIENHKRIRPRNLKLFLLFPVAPVVLGGLQLAFNGLSVTWLGEAFSMMMILLNVQNNMADYDYLTEIANRRSLEEYLTSEFRKKEPQKTVIGLMLDLDEFKKINDTFGHVVGDDALVAASAILRDCVGKNDFLARYAGDEFVIITKTNDDNDVRNLIKEIRRHTDRFNEEYGKPYNLSFSIGFDFSHRDGSDDVDEFIKRMDEKMYEDKKARKMQRL